MVRSVILLLDAHGGETLQILFGIGKMSTDERMNGLRMREKRFWMALVMRVMVWGYTRVKHECLQISRAVWGGLDSVVSMIKLGRGRVGVSRAPSFMSWFSNVMDVSLPNLRREGLTRRFSSAR